MKRKHLSKPLTIFLFSLLGYVNASAQDTTVVKSLNKIRLNILGLTFEREQKIGKLTTVYFGGGVAAVYSLEIGALEPVYDANNNTISYKSATKEYFDLTPTLYTGIRKYYHFQERIKKGKKTANNSSNYFGLDVASYLGSLLNQERTVSWEIGITPQWGIQRRVGKKVNFELSLGPTVRINKLETYFGADGRISFSFLL